MSTTIRRGFAALATAGLACTGLLMGGGTASASGGYYADHDSYGSCWNGGFHGFGFGYWAWHHGYWSDGWWHPGYWEWRACYDNSWQHWKKY